MTRSGEQLRVVWNTNIVRNEHGEPMYAVMTGIDVTAERTTAGLVSHLMDASFTTALVGVDTAGMITVLNSGAQHMLGYDGEELVGQPFHLLLQHAELLERTGADTPTRPSRSWCAASAATARPGPATGPGSPRTAPSSWSR